MQHSLQAAHDLERALDELMRLLDARNVAPAALERAARECELGFEALRAGFERDQHATRDELAGALRSNAITRDLVGRRLADVQQRLDRVRAARHSLSRERGGPAVGDSCDLAG